MSFYGPWHQLPDLIFTHCVGPARRSRNSLVQQTCQNVCKHPWSRSWSFMALDKCFNYARYNVYLFLFIVRSDCDRGSDESLTTRLTLESTKGGEEKFRIQLITIQITRKLIIRARRSEIEDYLWKLKCRSMRHERLRNGLRETKPNPPTTLDANLRGEKHLLIFSIPSLFCLRIVNVISFWFNYHC